MEAIEEIAPHHAVASSFVYVEPRASRDEDLDPFFIGIEKSFQKAFPMAVFVKFVKNDEWRRGSQFEEAEMFGHGFRTG